MERERENSSFSFLQPCCQRGKWLLLVKIKTQPLFVERGIGGESIPPFSNFRERSGMS